MLSSSISKKYRIDHSSQISINKELKRSLGVLMISISLLKYLVCVVLVLLVTSHIESSAESYTSQQINQHTGTLLNQTSSIMNEYLNMHANGLANTIAFSAQNMYYTDFIDISNPNVNYYYDNLEQPVEYFARELGNVSLGSSCYHFPYIESSNLSSLNSAENATVGLTNYLDTVWKTLYERYADIATVYIGVQGIDLLRKYPGTTNIPLSYNPTARPWYAQSFNNEGIVSITPPYVDAFGLGLMITFARNFSNPQNNELMGIVGCDLTLKTLQGIIGDITFYSTGNIILLQYEYANNKANWIVNQDGDTSFFSLMNLNLDFGVSENFELGQYIYLYTRMQAFGGQYFLIAKVDSSVVEAPIQAVSQDMKVTKINMILTLLIVFMTILGLTVVLIVMAIKGIVVPIQKIRNKTLDFINNGIISRQSALNQSHHNDETLHDEEEHCQLFRNIGTQSNIIDEIDGVKHKFEEVLDQEREKASRESGLQNIYFNCPTDAPFYIPEENF